MYDIPDFLRIPVEMQNHFAKGGMIKRADGSYSRRGLWDNIRANKGSGKKPTKQMLEQEARIKAKEYVVGGPITFSAGGEKHKVYEKESPTGNGKGVEGHIMVTHPTMDKGKWDTIDLTEKSGAKTIAQGVNATKQWHEENPEYGGGGYTVRRSHDRKGKTHVVIGPDGTKKYFGDAKLGQHPHDAARKKAFYARHKHNLAGNPYFRAFARKTWEDGGEVPEYDYGGFYGRNDAAKMQRMFTPNADSMSPKFQTGGKYIVKEGDNLWDVSQKQNIDINKIIKLNPQISDPNKIYPGQEINLDIVIPSSKPSSKAVYKKSIAVPNTPSYGGMPALYNNASDATGVGKLTNYKTGVYNIQKREFDKEQQQIADEMNRFGFSRDEAKSRVETRNTALANSNNEVLSQTKEKTLREKVDNPLEWATGRKNNFDALIGIPSQIATAAISTVPNLFRPSTYMDFPRAALATAQLLNGEHLSGKEAEAFSREAPKFMDLVTALPALGEFAAPASKSTINKLLTNLRDEKFINSVVTKNGNTVKNSIEFFAQHDGKPLTQKEINFLNNELKQRGILEVQRKNVLNPIPNLFKKGVVAEDYNIKKVIKDFVPNIIKGQKYVNNQYTMGNTRINALDQWLGLPTENTAYRIHSNSFKDGNDLIYTIPEKNVNYNNINLSKFNKQQLNNVNAIDAYYRNPTEANKKILYKAMSEENVITEKYKDFDPDKFFKNPNNTYGKPILLENKTVIPTYDYITGTGGGAPIIKQGNKITLKDVWDIQPFSRSKRLPRFIQNIDVGKGIGAKNFTLNQTYRTYPYGIRQTFKKGGFINSYALGTDDVEVDNTKQQTDLTPLPTIMGSERYSANNSSNKQRPAAYFNPNAMTTNNDEAYDPGTATNNSINAPGANTMNSNPGTMNNFKADPFSNNLFGATSPIAQQTPNIQTPGLNNQPQYQVAPNQSTMPATTNAIAPDGNGNYNGNVPNTIGGPQSNTSSPIGNAKSNFTTWGAGNQPKKKFQINQDTVNRVQRGSEALSDLGSNFLHVASKATQLDNDSNINAYKNYEMAQNTPVNTLNQIGTFKGIEYAKNGGSLSLRLRRAAKNKSYNEGDELDLTTQEIYALEKQGYKFQTL